MATISQTVNIEMLEKLPDGTYKKKNPATVAGQVTEETNKKFMTDAEKSKLTAIDANANNYSHPATHPASMITGLPEVYDVYTPIKGVDYFDGEQGPKGDKGDTGEQGEQGPKGDDGYTPVKGIDYFDGIDGKDGNDMFAFKIVDGNLIVVYQDISQSHDFSLNEAGELIYKF